LKVNNSVIRVNLGDGFTILANPQHGNSRVVLNRPQMTFLHHLGNGASVQSASEFVGMSQTTAGNTMRRLLDNGIISESGVSEHRNKRSSSSLDVWVHTTNSCSLRCTYCYIDKSNDHMSPEVMDKFAQRLLETAKAKKLKSIKLRLAGGEPMMRFGVWKGFLLNLKNDLKAIECKLIIVFLSNMTILTDEIMAFIKEERCEISVSLDGVKEYHDRTRVYPSGCGSFETVDRNIRKLIANGIRPYIMIVVSETTIEGLPELTDYLLGLGLGFRYSFVKGENVDLDKFSHYLKLCYKRIEVAIEDGYRFSKRHRLCDLSLSGPIQSPCGSGHNSFLLYTNGEMHLCPMALSDKQPIGQIQSKEDILDLIQQQGVYANLGTDDSCHDCKFAHNCASGCPLDRVNGKSRFCEIFKEFIPEIYRLIGKEMLHVALKRAA